MRDCDTLLVVGSSFPYTQFLPEFGQARAVQIDIDPHMIGLRYPFEVEPRRRRRRRRCERLLPMLDAEEARREWRETVEDERRALAGGDGAAGAAVEPTRSTRSTWSTRSTRCCPTTRSSPPTPVRPPTGTPGTCGCAATCAVRCPARWRRWVPAVPYAIGAKFAHPDRPAIALVGDGAMQMNGMAELITAAKYWRAVGGPAADRRRARTTTTSTRSPGRCGRWRAPRSSCPRSPLPDVPYADFARSLGLDGVRVEKPEDVEAGLARGARRRTGPFVIEFRTDPAVPPIPPHATWSRWRRRGLGPRATRTGRPWCGRASRRRCRRSSRTCRARCAAGTASTANPTRAPDPAGFGWVWRLRKTGHPLGRGPPRARGRRR